MRNTVRLILTFAVPLGILGAFGPWDAASDAEFQRRGLKVVFVAVFVFGVLRYGLPLVLGERADFGPSRFWRRNLSIANRPVKPWTIALIGLVGALGVLLVAQLFLYRFHINSRVTWTVATALQQIGFAAAAFYMTWHGDGSAKRLARITPLVAVAALSAWFALATPTILRALAENVERAPIEYVNLLFALPILILISLCGIWIARPVRS